VNTSVDLRTDGSELDIEAVGGALFVHTGTSGKPMYLNPFGGNVAIGTGLATARLEVAGGNGDVGATEGDFKVGDGTYRFKVGVATTGTNAGDVRVRAVGGTGRLMLGAGTTDAISITQDAVGFGTTAPTHPYHFKAGLNNIVAFESTGPETYLRLVTKEGLDNRVEFCNRPGGLAAIFVMGAGDALRVARDGSVTIAGNLTAGSITANGRVKDQRIRIEKMINSTVQIYATKSVTEWHVLDGMEMDLVSPGATFLLRFQIGGVQVQGVDHGQAEFRLLVDGAQQAYHLGEFHNNYGWELRVVSLERMLALAEGSHTVRVEWSVRSPDAKAATATAPEVRATLTGGWYADTRTLIAIEL
jgi:hypothetical protein